MCCLIHINSYLWNFSSHFCDKQNTSYAIKPKTLVSAIIMIQLNSGELNQIEIKWCYLVCAVANCDGYDDFYVMLACLVKWLFACIVYLSIRREHCRSLRGRRLLRTAGTRALCWARQATSLSLHLHTPILLHAVFQLEIMVSKTFLQKDMKTILPPYVEL